MSFKVRARGGQLELVEYDDSGPGETLEGEVRVEAPDVAGLREALDGMRKAVDKYDPMRHSTP